MLSCNNIEIVSGFSVFLHKTIYLKDLPRELVELPLDEIKSELERVLEFNLYKINRTTIKGRPGLVVLCNTEAQASAIQNKKSILKQVASNNGPTFTNVKSVLK